MQNRVLAMTPNQTLACYLFSLTCLLQIQSLSAKEADVEKVVPENISVKAIELPKYSAYLSDQTIAGLQQQDALQKRAQAKCNPYTKQTEKEIRDCEHEHYSVIMPEALKKYSANIQETHINDIPVHIITPTAGAVSLKTDRVLINLHGGGFKFGGGYSGQLESMPLAHYGGFKVIAIDYKKSPNHRFPAANIDVETVYRHLLKTYKPQQIGIFGCSAGSRVTGQSLVHINDQKLPMLGASAFLCSAPTALNGDSNTIAAAITQREPLQIGMVEYWQGLSADNQQAFPGDFTQQVKKFPPSLLITSGRDYSLSPMIAMHRKLVQQNKIAELHVFEGLTHAQFLSMYIPEAKETALIMTDFFDRHLRD
jgi:acetyl esterase/lipase